LSEGEEKQTFEFESAFGFKPSEEDKWRQELELQIVSQKISSELSKMTEIKDAIGKFLEEKRSSVITVTMLAEYDTLKEKFMKSLKFLKKLCDVASKEGFNQEDANKAINTLESELETLV
jgi:CMP-N-acetylneuraminic acid synthetase